MSEIRDLMKTITNDNTPYQKRAIVCKVRDFGTDSTNNKATLLYHVEPIDGENYINKTYKNQDGTAGTMTKDEMELSQDNWIFDVTVNADPSNVLTSGAKFELPNLDSFVIIEWLNDTDAYITVTSSLSEIKIKVGDKTFSITPKEFNVRSSKADLEILMKNNIKLRNKHNSITVNEKTINLYGGNDNASIDIVTSDQIILSANHNFNDGNPSNSTDGGTIFLDDKVKINNDVTDFKLNILNEIVILLIETNKNIASVNKNFTLTSNVALSGPTPIAAITIPDANALSTAINNLFS